MFIASHSVETPAASASKLLISLGLVTLMTVMPVLSVAAEGAIYVLMPIGAATMLIGAVIGAEGHGPRHLMGALGSPAGLAALFVAFWAGLSLVWTPFPAEAAPRFAQIVVTTLLVALVAAWLPPRTRTFDLYLLPVGVTLNALSLLYFALRGETSFAGAGAFGDSLFARAMIALVVLVWPALGALCLRERWAFAAGLALLAAGVAFAGFAQAGLAAMGAGAFVFALAMSNPSRIGPNLGAAFAALILAAPLFALGVGALAGAWPEAGPGARSMEAWREMIVSDWPRLVTGHGFGSTDRMAALGFLSHDAPRGLPFIVWHDLGLVGAGAFALLTALTFRLTARVPESIAPSVLAGLSAVLALSFLGAAVSQIWWITLLDCAVIAYVVLIKGVYRSQRPTAPRRDEAPAAPRDLSLEPGFGPGALSGRAEASGR
ncbi:hypothetical protein [Methylocella sp.]|uniref:hypothetical protein n=1 Tax=Methylocella sp. TaxID=1978226 RepID=UPI003784AFD2